MSRGCFPRGLGPRTYNSSRRRSTQILYIRTNDRYSFKFFIFFIFIVASLDGAAPALRMH